MSNADSPRQEASSRTRKRKALQPPAFPSDLVGTVNDASSRAAALWLSFLTFMVYLTLTVGAVTHEALLKQTPIKLPVLNVELPVVGFFWIAPIFFILFHFYLFLQLLILVRKVASYNTHLNDLIATEKEREEYRRRLDTFLIVQFLSGTSEEREGITGKLLRSISVITLVVAPILMLLQFQLTFLPYHDAWVTWVHRFAVLVDIRLAWVFWFAIRSGDGKILFPELQIRWGDLLKRGLFFGTLRTFWARMIGGFRDGYAHHRLGSVSSIVVLFFSFFVFAYGEEPVSRLVQIPVPHISNDELEWEVVPVAEVALHGPINMVQGRPRVWFSNVLVVPNKKIVTDEDVEKDFPSISLRGRNLSGAVLIGSDLRRADFTGANLNEARLDGAILTHAKFGCASPYNVKTKANWPGDECTWLQRANLSEAHLDAADLSRARMHGAILIGAWLQTAKMSGTQLERAMLSDAQLQGADLEGANLKYAFLDGASLIGAKLTNTRIQGVLLGNTKFDLTLIEKVGSPALEREPIRITSRRDNELPKDNFDNVGNIR
jgi:uncharacterized protein YjbI with pentapeptide repeats